MVIDPIPELHSFFFLLYVDLHSYAAICISSPLCQTWNGKNTSVKRPTLSVYKYIDGQTMVDHLQFLFLLLFEGWILCFYQFQLKKTNLYDFDGTVANINKKDATNRLNVYIVV